MYRRIACISWGEKVTELTNRLGMKIEQKKDIRKEKLNIFVTLKDNILTKSILEMSKR